MAPPVWYIALLRAANVGGNTIAMPALRAMCDDLGLVDARTLLNSGNLVFRTRVARSKLTPRLEDATKQRFGVPIDYLIRTADEWAALIAANPFPREALADPAHLVVMCCRDVVETASIAALNAAIKDRERARGAGSEVYITYPDGIGTSRLTNATIERALGTRGTARNWNTVLKLAALTTG